MRVFEHAFAYCILAGLGYLMLLPLSSARAERASLWGDIDSGFVRLALWFRRFIGAPISTITQDAKTAGTRERVFAGRMAIAGLLLLAVLPFHRMFFTDPFIDSIWWFVNLVVNAAELLGLGPFIHIDTDWRGEEYYLWELAAFLWAVVQFSLGQYRDIRHLTKGGLIAPDTAFILGAVYLGAALTISFMGFIILIAAISLWVLLFETFVVFVATSMEIFLTRIYFRGGFPDVANRGAQAATFIEVPALLAFILASLFVVSAEGFTRFPSHWSHAFASGASALNLVLANMGLLMIRAVRQPSERIPDAQR